MYMKKYGKYVAMIILILIGMCFVFYNNLDYSYQMHGDTVSVKEYIQTGSGYDIQGIGSPENNTESEITFKVTGDDPQFYLNDIGQQTGGIELIFAKSCDKDIPVQVFYADSPDKFKEKNSFTTDIKAGETSCLIPVPIGEYNTIRLDIEGDFVLTDINICTDKMKVTPFISGETVKSCAIYFPVIIISILLIFWAHSVRAKGMTGKAYAKTVFLGKEITPDHDLSLDYLRVLAAVLVILAHSCSPMVEEADAPWKRLLLVTGLTIGLCCNLIYCMISGTLLLSSKKEEKVSDFYIRRASRVIIPLISYYLLLLLLNNEVNFIPPKHLWDSFKRIMTGAPDAAPHLWLIYTIVALYIATPFFRVMVQHLGDKMLLSLVAVIFVVNLCTNYMPLFGMNFGFTNFLAGWDGVFLLGYIMAQPNVRKYDKKLMITGVISFVAAIAVVFNDAANMNYVYNNAPTMILMSCGIYAIFMRHKEWFATKANLIIRLCSKYSYAIILIHWYVLFVIVQGKLHVTAMRFGCIGGIVATVALTFAICLGIGLIYDNTVVIIANVIFEKIVSLFKRNNLKS